MRKELQRAACSVQRAAHSPQPATRNPQLQQLRCREPAGKEAVDMHGAWPLAVVS